MKLFISSSVLNPASLPTETCGKEQIQALGRFYRKKGTIVYEGISSSPALNDGDELVGEQHVFQTALVQAKSEMKERKFLKAPNMQDDKAAMESSQGYTRIFLEIFKLLSQRYLCS